MEIAMMISASGIIAHRACAIDCVDRLPQISLFQSVDWGFSLADQLIGVSFVFLDLILV